MPWPPSPHALIVPANGQGHINGCMLLARSLSSLGFSISFVYFSTTYSDLRRKNRLPYLDNHSAISIYVVPDGFEYCRPHFYFAATTAMRRGLEQLVEKLNHEHPVTCLISDTFVPWTQDVADKFGLPRIDYWTSSAMGYLMITNIGLLHSKRILPAKGSPNRWKSENPVMVDCIPGLPPFPVEHYARETRCAEFSDPFVQFFASVGAYAKRSERLLIHTVHELETTALAALGRVRIPAYAIGPLLHHTTSRNTGAPNEEQCLKWLDKQAHSSVIYVAFGTFVCLSRKEIEELASGLEASEQAFLWVIGADTVPDRYLSYLLPEGFLERMKERCMIVSWAPQVKVLEHAAVGGFLTHCGWNSTMESLLAGVPLLGCPRAAEQRANLQYIVEEWKMGLELERTECGGVDRRDVERGVRALMQEREGVEAKSRAQELKEAAVKASLKGGVSLGNLQKFYEDMCLLSKLNSSKGFICHCKNFGPIPLLK